MTRHELQAELVYIEAQLERFPALSFKRALKERPQFGLREARAYANERSAHRKRLLAARHKYRAALRSVER